MQATVSTSSYPSLAVPRAGGPSRVLSCRDLPPSLSSPLFISFCTLLSPPASKTCAEMLGFVKDGKAGGARASLQRELQGV